MRSDWTRICTVVLACAPWIISTGCTTTHSQAEIKFLETRQMDLRYEDAYNASLDAVFSMGLSITHTDRSSGVIVAQSGDHAQRAAVDPIWRSRYPVKKITLMIRARGERVSQLRMKVLINEKQKLDRTLMTAIWQRIEREAMLDMLPSAPRPARTATRSSDSSRPRE